jgi:hypothetical protein
VLQAHVLNWLNLGERLSAFDALEALYNAISIRKTASFFDAVAGATMAIQLDLSSGKK